MSIDLLKESIKALVSTMNSLFAETALAYDVVNKIRSEFNCTVSLIQTELSNTNRIHSVPFERNMGNLAEICKRVVFACTFKNNEPNSFRKEKAVITQFFGELNYPIDLNEPFFDDQDSLLEDENNIIYTDINTYVILSAKNTFEM